MSQEEAIPGRWGIFANDSDPEGILFLFHKQYKRYIYEIDKLFQLLDFLWINLGMKRPQRSRSNLISIIMMKFLAFRKLWQY